MIAPKSEQSPAPEAEVAQIESNEPEGAEVKPPPPPWTPERALEWNRYYDIYIIFGVLMLVFVASANLVRNQTLWAHLKSGELSIQASGPITTEPFSLTEYNQPKVNANWLFETTSALVNKLATSVAPGDIDPTIAAARAEQWGIGALVGLHAFIRLLTCLCLLFMRRKGPSFWWTSLCAMFALGVMYTPVGLKLGGIAEPGEVTPEAWGTFFLAFEILALHRAINLGKTGWIYVLVPLFALWSNVDESFLVGLLVLGGSLVGFLGKKTNADSEGSTTTKQMVIVTVASFLATMVNPWLFNIYGTAFEPFANLFAAPSTEVFLNEVSFFGTGLQSRVGKESISLYRAYYVIIVSLGLLSFVLNHKRPTLGRFVVFAIGAILWGIWTRTGASFAIIFAATVALNGQEWWLDTFGSEGRLGFSWSLWSVGGRSLTLVIIAIAAARAITGYGVEVGEPTFGLGFNPEDFPFEAADYLRSAKIEGNIFNSTGAQGDAIIWRAGPIRKPYIDTRPHVYSRQFWLDHMKLRRALSEDDVAVWKETLDKNNISVVMIEESGSPKTYQVLNTSPNWIPFYDDGRTQMFGRADAKKEDVAFFENERLDANFLVYQNPRPAVPVALSPTPPDLLGSMLPANRSRPGSHTMSASRWLRPITTDPSATSIPDPAHCFMAIREARAALAKNANDSYAFRRLAEAYRFLLTQESALLSGLELKPENIQKINQTQPQFQLLQTRYKQLVTSLHYAIQTTPPPENAVERFMLRGLKLELAQLYLNFNALDLGRDLLKEVLADPAPRSDQTELLMSDELRAQISQEAARLDEQIEQVTKQMNDFAIERQAGPIDLANLALQGGLVGQAIAKLEEANASGMTPQIVRPRLLDEYCRTGQPDKALDLLSGENEDAALNTGPGTSAYRNGLVSFLIGNWEVALFRWERTSIPQIQMEQLTNALMAGNSAIRGEVKSATSGFLDLPTKVGTQATWEYDLGMCLLESGAPVELTAEHLTRSLTLVPDMALRPVVVYYLTKFGKPIPPEVKPEPSAAAKPEEATKPAESAAKTEVPVEPAKPAESTAKPEENPAKPAEPAVPKVEEPVKPAEPTAKPAEPTAKPETPPAAPPGL